ncbi:MAG: penicillin-binding protein 1C [Paracoccaceae bacterium]
MRRIALFLLVGLLFAAAATRDAVDRWVADTVLPPLIPETSVEVRARDGSLLRAFTVADGRWRLETTATGVDERFVEMLMAYEDRRFDRHGGVDPLALLRSAGQALRHGQIVSGGSTLTMQVARLLENSGTGRWRGKLRQMRVAMALERRLTKREILSLYLTLAPYGGNLEGVRAATLAWFGKEPERLTLAEAALLVALPQSPEARRPDRHRDAARAARNRVLARMMRAGVIAPEAARAAQGEPVPARMHDFPAMAPHLAERVRRDAPGRGRHWLTLDPRLQRAVETLAGNILQGQDARLGVALIVADHQSGEILASVGSGRWGQTAAQGFVDMTQAPRSPGSTLKPLVYALAFDEGLAHPQTLMDDRPVAFGTYAPRNFDGVFRGEVTVAEALRLSLNIPVVLLIEELGPARLMAALARSGARARLTGGKPGLAVALGGVGVTLEDLVQLYAGLANGGQAMALRVTGPGAPGPRIVSRAAAWQVSHILAGLAPPPGAPQRRLAWKTGTSYGHRDAWAIGHDGRHVAGVWIGRPDGTPVPGAFGADMAAPVLFELFQRLGPEAAPLPPPPPEALILSTAALPQPLQRFRGRNAVFEAPDDALRLAFPPDGARLALEGALTVKLRAGTPPFTVLADGRPLVTGAQRRELSLPFAGEGFAEIAVIDAEGRSDRVRIRLD